ncbi:MAG: hypothetical protein GY696_00595, partial [Gammaproteobacteria bacterium]|nr:hypothetical protein [Gammaproteobacteria bacterium]
IQIWRALHRELPIRGLDNKQKTSTGSEGTSNDQPLIADIPRENTEKGQAQKGREKRLAELMLVVTVVFAVVWTPNAIVVLIGHFGTPGTVLPWVATVTSVVAKSSTLYNPFLYAFKDFWFRRALRKYIFCKDLPMGEYTGNQTTHTETAVA